MRMPGILSAAASGGGGGYTAKAVHFDGASVNLASASLTCTDSQYVASAMWLKFNVADQHGGEIWTVDPTGDYGSSYATGSGPNVSGGVAAAGGNPFLAWAGGPSLADTWFFTIFACQTNLSAGLKLVKCYINDIDATSGIADAGASFLSAISGRSFYLGDDTFGDGYVGDMADFRFMVGTNLLVAGDIPLATRRLFIDGSGKPVDPATATAALGTPTILFSGDHTTFPVNQGLGGAFTLTGTLTDASTHP